MGLPGLAVMARLGSLAVLGACSSLPHLSTPIASYAGSDYPWRILCPAADLPRFMSTLTTSIDYGNFKSAIAASPTQRPKLSAYHDIHHRMVEWQQKHEPT